MNIIKQKMKIKRQKRVLNQRMPMWLIVLVRDAEKGVGGPYSTTY